jgi:hypothetical protein
MNLRRTAAAAALALALALPAFGCAALYHGAPRDRDGEMAPDSSSMAILVDNQNDEAVRVFMMRGAGASWIGTVSPMTSQALVIPADVPGGGGAMTIRVLTLSGQSWDVRGIVPKGGATLKLDIGREIKLSNWSMR